jgi:hypothetical protein
MIRKTAAAAAAALAVAGPAHAVDGVSFELGRGDGADLWRAGVQWRWDKKWFAERRWNLVAYWDLSAGVWEHRDNSLNDIALTPTFRLQPREFSAVAPYLEGAIGFHFLSEVRVGGGKVFSTKFQFGDHIGAGVRFGGRHRWDLGVRLQHLSNGRLREPNPGINFVQLRLAYHFR